MALSQVNQQATNLRLGEGMVAPPLAHMNFFRVGVDQVKNFGANQRIVEHHIRPLQ